MSTQAAPAVGLLPVWTFADKFRKARVMSGLTQEQFALRIELSPSTVAAYETGRAAPRFKDAQRVAKSLGMLTGVPYAWFLHDDDPNETENPMQNSF
jgi:transcriptional regulator with XRE-family HTH domain